MARSISAFLNATEAALTASPLIGPLTNRSITSSGIDGSAADLAAMAALFNFGLLGLDAPCGHALPRTQNSLQAPLPDRDGHMQALTRPPPPPPSSSWQCRALASLA